MLCKARQAASGSKPRSRAIWWSGTAVEATFKNLHSAEAAIARLFTENEIRAEIPEAVARAAAVLDRDDPRRAAALSLFQCVGVGADKVRRCDAEILSRIIQIGHDAADHQRAKLRQFRNIILLGALVTLLVMVAFIVIVAKAPAAVPLCFPKASIANQNSEFVCPTTSEGGPSGGDVPIVALIGLLGGALSGVAFVGNLKSNSTPYNISVPLALLKIPAGALTAVAAVIVLAGDFVPGFSAIDSQAQILAYALIFGFAQQLFTRLLDQRARDLASNIPSKASIDEPRGATNWPEIDLTSADADDTMNSNKGR